MTAATLLVVTFEDHTGQDWTVEFPIEPTGNVLIGSDGCPVVRVELPFSVVERLAAEVVRMRRHTAVEQAAPEDLLS